MSGLARLNDVSVGKRLTAGFVVVVAFSIVLIMLALKTMGDYRQRSVIVGEAASAESYLLNARTEEKNFVIRGDLGYLRAAGELADKAADQLQALKDVLVVAEDDARVDGVVKGVEKYKSLLSRLQARVESDNNDITALEQQIVEVARRNVATAVELQDVQLKRMKEQYDTAVTSFTTIGVLAVLSAGLIAWFMVRSITQPIRETVEIANKVASNDLTVRIDSNRSDEFGQLLSAFSTMVTNLRELIKQIDEGASNIASSSEELSTVTEQTSRDVAAQSDGTDQVATAMNEMVATVNEVAKSAEAAFESARRADEKAQEGETSVEETLSHVGALNTMTSEVMEQLRELQGDTQSIVTVLEVIKAVADQTNLLALNAAIEAARAGEHGRGFSVVADEVRSLAQRTQQSATEIETLISNLVSSAESSVDKMAKGSAMAEDTLSKAQQAGNTIRDMTEAVEEIRQFNSQIATAAEQQTSTAEDINRNITRIRDIAEQSSTSTEQVSASSDELARLAEGLSSQVSRFRI
ncbi:methyl-accepting chemotaxis protein [Marinobacter sp. ATCH36]|uniref:methyl-accepting chemotaxis protein n=1 Tax=Marinobacter sp. ATCH36 TaxID=2945106 RepID=UPI002020DD72|nr:methyl-accepting chemotaxis protein [Marinobacter sp. ATCH36]MCL7942915.1 methyl-accepting chemotaxis protein [Marinobacter sp. ATCH36]